MSPSSFSSLLCLLYFVLCYLFSLFLLPYSPPLISHHFFYSFLFIYLFYHHLIFLFPPFSSFCLHLSYLCFSSLSFSLLFSYSKCPCFLFSLHYLCLTSLFPVLSFPCVLSSPFPSQFVPFRDYIDRRGNHILSMARLAKEVLAEIPDQFLSYMRTRGIKPGPLPPPYTPCPPPAINPLLTRRVSRI